MALRKSRMAKGKITTGRESILRHGHGIRPFMVRQGNMLNELWTRCGDRFREYRTLYR